MAAFDGLERVIRIGSFSKTLSNAMRCGYVAAKSDWIAALGDLRIATGLSGSPLAAQLVHNSLADVGSRRHLEHLRVRVEQQMDRTIKRLRGIGLTPWIEPKAGFFLWAALPEGIGAVEVARRGLT